MLQFLVAMLYRGPVLIRPIKQWEYPRVQRSSIGTVIVTARRVYAFGSYARLYR